MSKLTHTLQAFLGNAEAAVSLLGDALCAAVITMAQHGTRAPVDEAIALIEALKGRTLKEKAARAGLAAVIAQIRGFKPGTVTKDDAATIGAAVASGFVLAAVELMTAPKVTYAKPSGADVASRALKTLAELNDAQVSALLKTAAGADLMARMARVQAVAESIAQAKQAEADALKAKRATAAALANASAPAAAPAAPVPLLQAA
jgi:hypothetical protein